MQICKRVNLSNPDYIHYHNTERGKLVTDDRRLFEMLILEGAQAWLSRETVLKKRSNYQTAFFDYDLERIANLDDQYLQGLMLNPWLIRNRLKLFSVRQNAQVFLKICKEYGRFYEYLCAFTQWKIFNNSVPDYKLAPSCNDLAVQISKDLKKQGMNFVGPTIIYAYLQAIGIINDHENDCDFKDPAN